MEYFVSKNHDSLNGKPFVPELYSRRICLNPRYKVTLDPRVKRPVILLDSGAFQDLKTDNRLTPSAALSRQFEFEERAGFKSRLLVSYDRIVDESPTIRGVRRKRRVSYHKAERYVEETVDAAKYLADNRDQLGARQPILSCQGVTVPQYLRCLREVLSFTEPDDVIGLGGFCIVGQIPRFAKSYYRTLEAALPIIKRRGLRRIHIFGIGVFSLLIRTHVLCHRYGIVPSYDTSSLELNAVYGRVFKPDTRFVGPDGVHLTNVFSPSDKYQLYHPADWAMMNIEMVNLFWDRLNRLYPVPKPAPAGYA